MTRLTALCLGVLVALSPVQAADFSDPTWPCVQRKVPRLSIGLMWPLPLADSPVDDPQLQREIFDMAEALSLRRTELEDLEPAVTEFAESHGGDPQLLGRVFQQVFNALAARRSRIIEGIEDFSISQIALSKKIDGMRAEMDVIMASDTPDFDRADALEEQLDWDQVIYTDRQQSITYLCETPTLLEKRLFGIAQMLQRHVSEAN